MVKKYSIGLYDELTGVCTTATAFSEILEDLLDVNIQTPSINIAKRTAATIANNTAPISSKNSRPLAVSFARTRISRRMTIM